MYRFKVFYILLHIAGWAMFMLFPLVSLNRHNDTFVDTFAIIKSPEYWLFGFTFMVLFYSNIYYFTPIFFLKKKYITFGSVVIGLLICIYIIRPFDRLIHVTEQNFVGQSFHGQRFPPGGLDDGPPPPPPNMKPPGNGQKFPSGFPKHGPPLDVTSLSIFVMILTFSTAAKITQQWRLTEQRAISAEADKARAELSFLKTQISPHFLFNTLNNIYTLALTKDDHAADSIMKLSNIMRYITDDINDDFVLLQNELDCINDYIELQRLRVGSSTIIDYHSEGKAGQMKIAPLILITFIENCFKYGISKQTKSLIQIKIIVNEINIALYCKNRIFVISNKENKRSGIGINNTRKRIEHLYQGKHLLNISCDNQEYIVHLTLQT